VNKALSAIQHSLYFLSLSCPLSLSFLRCPAPSLARSTSLASFFALAVFSRSLSDIFLRSLTVARARTLSPFLSLAHALARMLTRSLTRSLRQSLFFGARAPSVGVSDGKALWNHRHISGRISGGRPSGVDAIVAKVSFFTRKGGVDGAVGRVLAANDTNRNDTNYTSTNDTNDTST